MSIPDYLFISFLIVPYAWFLTLCFIDILADILHASISAALALLIFLSVILHVSVMS